MNYDNPSHKEILAARKVLREWCDYTQCVVEVVAASILVQKIAEAIHSSASAQGAPEAVAMWRDAADAKDVRINKLEAMLAARAQGMPNIKAVFDQIEKVAFSIPPANPYTPQIVQLCIAGRTALTSTDGNLAVDRDSDRSTTVPDQVKQQHAGPGGGMTTPDSSTERCDGADDLEHLDGMLDDRERG